LAIGKYVTGLSPPAYNVSVASDTKIDLLIRELPDETSARLFLNRLQTEQPHAYQKLQRDTGLFADCIALAAWSPLLATTLEQNPDYLSWLARERGDTRVRTRDQLKESLARFALTHSTVAPQVLFARFRRRELLRIYLHDVRRAHTLVETTEELSNLADAILDYALSLARQELDNRYGSPLRDDNHGRTATAEFCVVALGKLGSGELNYSSDIDLLFLYSDEGTTTASGERGKLTNREYFIKLSEVLSKLVGEPTGEGAAYRVDLRLRPHGRDGTLACSLAEALKYYERTAQNWELQALIRSRASAGSSLLFSRFVIAVQPYVYRPHISVKDALASVRLAKQKIDRHIERSKDGFNVKLQRGGIREIEFIAQALQLAHGGRDEWLRVTHTLISLGRLADRNLITEHERTTLSDAYVFLRTLEHRLQMEHGLQTHTVPQPTAQRTLVARRMGFSGETALEDFNRALDEHTRNVRLAYDRVFAGADETLSQNIEPLPTLEETATHGPRGSDARMISSAVKIFSAHIQPGLTGPPAATTELLAHHLLETVRASSNPHRSAILLARVAASLDKSGTDVQFAEDSLLQLAHLCGASEFLGDMTASNPSLIKSLAIDAQHARRRDYRALLRAAIDPQKTFADELSALRREWSRLIIEIAAHDVAGHLSLSASNQLQTELAVAATNVGLLIARREMARRYGRLAAGPRASVLALGRLASAGVDYGSDLDIVLVYDSLVSSPVASLTQDEAYARLCELLLAALSSVTRDGYLYRVDLRLRPDGKNGPLVIGSEAFLDYVKGRTAIWEWLAYVKLRAVAGDLELGRMIETHARHAVHEKARAAPARELSFETRRVRERLEKSKGKPGRHRGIDIKYSAGGMLDVYFAARFLQLRDDVSDEGEARSTASTLERLAAAGSLDAVDYEILANGYALLRSVDHHLRLIIGKVTALPSVDHVALKEIAAKLNFESAVSLRERVIAQMRGIREAYDRITQSGD
jgi:glutamate-ammonia-ligase adenylyltransferase